MSSVAAVIVVFTYFDCVLVGSVLSQTESPERPAVYFVQQPPTDVIGHVGGSVYINCSARSRDLGPVEVTWLKDGRDATEGDARRFVTETGALVIAPVMTSRVVGTSGLVERSIKASDDGVYVCVARHPSGTIVSTPVTLHVAMLADKFETSPQDVTVVTGQSARFSCSIMSVPAASISWLNNSQPLTSLTSHRVSVFERLGVLHIGSVSNWDEASYRCVASSDGQRRVSDAARLVVSDHAGVEVHRSVTVTVRPPGRLTAIVGSDVVVECFVSSFPQPVVTWTRLASRQPPLGSLKALDVAGAGVLRIDSVQLSDSGVYVCMWNWNTTTVDDELGVAYLNLTVIAGPVATVGLLDPVVRRRHGQSLSLHCQFRGVPRPAVDWLKDGEVISSQQHSSVYISTLDDDVVDDDDADMSVITSELVVEQSSLRESGMYQCRASNVAGVAVLTTSVDILATDITLAAVVNVEATVLSSSSILITWQDAPTNNATSVVAYSVHFFPTSPRQQEVQRVVRTSNDTLRNLRPDTEYVIYVTAYAYRGTSAPSQHVVARTFAEEAHLPDDISSNVHNIDMSRTGTSASVLRHHNYAATSSDKPMLSDQLLGAVVGSCIGVTCIIVSIIVAVCRVRREMLTRSAAAAAAAGGAGGNAVVANGCVPSSRPTTVFCQCHHPHHHHHHHHELVDDDAVLPPSDAYHLVMNVQPPDHAPRHEPQPTSHMLYHDTKGGPGPSDVIGRSASSLNDNDNNHQTSSAAEAGDDDQDDDDDDDSCDPSQVALLDVGVSRSSGGYDPSDLETRSTAGFDVDLVDQQRPLQVANEDTSPW